MIRKLIRYWRFIVVLSIVSFLYSAIVSQSPLLQWFRKTPPTCIEPDMTITGEVFGKSEMPNETQSETNRNHTFAKDNDVFVTVTVPSDLANLVRRETIQYAQFDIKEPNFVNDEDRTLFFHNSTNNRNMVGTQSAEKLVGEIYTIRNGTFQQHFDCGYKSDAEYVTRPRHVSRQNWYRSLVPLVIPDGHTFQHFLDGTLPKIIQILPLLQKHNVNILMNTPRDQIVYEFFEKLNISRRRLVFNKGNSYGADYLIFTCITPPLHPRLWSSARTALGAPEYRQVSWSEAKVVVVTRAGCFNCGRRILNLEQLVQSLKSHYGNSSVVVFEGPFNLKDTLDLFGKAKLVIGTHGGGMYNIIFCPRNTTVVEIMPQYRGTGKQIAGAPIIIWVQAVMLGHNFWRLSMEPQNSKGDVDVNITKVQEMIKKIGH